MILQLVVFQIGFNLLYPKNLNDVSGVFVNIVIFDILPSEKINRYIFEFSELLNKKTKNSRLELLGYETNNFLFNTGTLLILLQLYLFVLMIYFLLCCKAKCVKKLRYWLQRKLLWNNFIDFFSAAQLEFILSGLL